LRARQRTVVHGWADSHVSPELDGGLRDVAARSPSVGEAAPSEALGPVIADVRAACGVVVVDVGPLSPDTDQRRPRGYRPPAASSSQYLRRAESSVVIRADLNLHQHQQTIEARALLVQTSAAVRCPTRGRLTSHLDGIARDRSVHRMVSPSPR
jgi:hypothetical protein